jgi:Tfp pilus assembly protein PilN
MRAVNLLTYDASFEVSAPRLRLPKSGLPVAAAVAGAIVCGFVALQFTNAQADVSSLENDLAAVQAQQAALEAEQPKGDPNVLAERRQRESALATALGYRVAWENVLGDVGYVLPPDVLLTQLHAETPTSPVLGAPAASSTGAPAGTVPTGFTVTGVAPSQRVVAQALRRLALVPALTNVTLQSSVKSDKSVSFTIAANVRQKEGTTP